MTISPTSNPEVSAGVSGSIADTTTGLLPWILKPNSSFPRRTTTVLSLSVNKIELSNEPCKIHAKVTRRRKSTKMCQGRYEFLKKRCNRSSWNFAYYKSFKSCYVGLVIVMNANLHGLKTINYTAFALLIQMANSFYVQEFII